MKFFNGIKRRIRLCDFLMVLLCLALTGLTVCNVVYTGFSTETSWQIGPRGSKSGIPLPNWLVSSVSLLLAAITFAGGCAFLVSVFKSSEYKKMMQAVAKLGDAEELGRMLGSMEKNKNAKGDLRIGGGIVFYRQGTSVTVLSFDEISAVRTKIEGSGSRFSELNYVCLSHGQGVLKIRSSAKKVLLLLEDVKTALAPAPAGMQ